MRRFKTRSHSFLALLAATGLMLGACGGSGGSGESHTAASPPSEPAAKAPSPPPSAAAAALGTSAVAGTVVFKGEVPHLKPITMDADPVCEAKHEGPVPSEALLLGEGQTLGNVFVQVKNPPAGDFAPPAEPAVFDQRGCLYHPHVLGLMAGQGLLIKNSDGLLHNVHGQPKVNRQFNIGMPGTLTEAKAPLDKPEPLFPVKCDVHPWMHAFVAVLSHPFFAVTGESGEFRIEGLPAGTYEIEAWHEKLGTQSASVTVGEGETGKADFTFSAPTGG